MKQNWIKKTMLLILTVSLSSLGIMAQTNVITGKVSDTQDGEALPGVTIQVKGSSIGTITDFDGNYSIKVMDNQTLIFSFIGYVTQEIAATSNLINVQLATNTESLDELIVIGYGVQKKSDKTGAVASINAEDMIGGALTDPLQAIQGQVAGVTITKQGGDPNSGFVVKIRGASGFDSNTQPLYVIDGIPDVDPTTVAPEDIASYNILKDAASTAIYGSRGSNGVIIITTKSGTSGKSKFNVNIKTSIDQAANRLDLLSADDIRNYVSENNLNFVDGGGNTDWQDEIFRTGITTSYNLNYSGGSENTTYYASVTQANWEGIMIGTAKERTIGKINLTHKALNDRLTLASSISGTFEKNDYEDYEGNGLKDILYQGLSRNPTDPVRNEDGSYNQLQREFNYVNPVATTEEVENTRDAKRFYGSFKADFEIIDGLIATANAGYTRDDHEGTVFESRDSWATTTSGYLKRYYDNKAKKSLEAYGTYAKDFGDHSLNVMGGYSWQETNGDGFTVAYKNANSDYVGPHNISSLTTPDIPGTSSFRYMSRLIGFFGRAQYNYQGKYYASASIRRDGSTKFGKENPWGTFPTVSVGWNIHEEDFMSDFGNLTNLKLRASWGQSGNEAIGEYHSQVVRSVGNISIDPSSGADVISFETDWNSNAGLKWEETTETNIGLDFGFFNNRISGSLELYRKFTTDLLGEFSVPKPPNIAQYTWGNSGEMLNQGVELFVQAFPVSQRNFKWKTTVNISHNTQKMTDLGQFSPADGVPRKEGYIEGRGLTSSYVIGVIEGESLGTFYLPVYVTLADGKMIYKSKTGGYTDNIADAQREAAGSALPDVEFGWSNTLTFFKDWSLDFAFRSMVGNKVFNATRMLFDVPTDLPNLNRLHDALDWKALGRTSPAAESDYYVEDASFLKLDYLSLNYQINTSKINWLSNLKVSFSGNNLFVLTNYSGIDPETSMDGVDFGIDQYDTYPKTRTFTVGVSASF